MQEKSKETPDRTTFNYLPLTLSMETKGGLSTPLVQRGTPLPAKRTHRFTTAVDKQKAVSVQVYLGESPIAVRNILVGKVELSDIPEAPRGQPEIDVTFEVDEKFHIRVIAKENKTGKAISSEIGVAEAYLIPGKIKEIIQKTTEARRKDEDQAQQIEANNNAHNLIHRVEKYLQNQQRYGPCNATDKQIEEVLAGLGLSLQENDIVGIREKTERLEKLLQKVDSADFSSLFSTDIFEPFFGGKLIRTGRQSQNISRPTTEKAGSSIQSKKQPLQSGVVTESKKGLFTAGQYFDAKCIVKDLFAQATNEICIIDAFVGEDVLKLLTAKRENVQVKLLTGKPTPVFLTLARDFNRQYKRLQVKSSKVFHDRFVIIDKKSIYHFGASLEHLGNKTFLFSKIEEPSLITALHKQWHDVWDKATVEL